MAGPGPGAGVGARTLAAIQAAVAAWLSANPPAAGKDGTNGKDGAPRRVDIFAGAVMGSSGVADIVFSPPFAAPPVVLPIVGWAGAQMVAGTVSNVTASGCKVTARISRATILLNNSPFETAPAATAVMVAAIGTPNG